MELLYIPEHLSCYNYENGSRPLIQIYPVSKGYKLDITPIESEVVFITQGRFHFFYNDCLEKEIEEGDIVLLPSDKRFAYEALEDGSVTVFRLRGDQHLCDRFSLEQLLLEEDAVVEDEFHTLKMNERTREYINILNTVILEGLRCVYFFELKIKELFFLYRAYYKKEELLRFFHPLLTKDMSFSNFVMRNHQKYKTVKELASQANYSVSGFEKRFRKVFGVSASSWMKEQKAKRIYHDLNIRKKPLKEISEEYGFYSPSHFNDYCKTNFGATPGNIRKKKKSIQV